MKSAAGPIDVLSIFLDVGFLLENSAVFQSQVGGQLVALSRMGYTTGVLAVVRDEAQFERAIGARLRAAGVQITLVPAGNFFGELARLGSRLRQLVREREVRNAYVRGIWGPLVIAWSRTRLPYVYDVRGSLADEMLAMNTPAHKRRLYLALERWAIRGARSVSAVTRVLADLVRARHGRDVTVVPCCVDTSVALVPREVRAARRAELGYDEECVFAYSGGLSHYQQVPAMLELWRRLLDEPDLRFLLLTNEDPHKAPQQVGNLADFGDRLRHLSLPHSQVAATLAAADLGFMLRDARELNRVASPVKFPEYLCAGLVVIGSPATGDASALIAEGDVGALIDPCDLDAGEKVLREFIGRWRRDRTGFRERGQALVRDHYDWQAYAPVFALHYGVPGARSTGR